MSSRDTKDAARLGTQESKILTMLRQAGSRGCTNAELWAVCHAVNSRVADLRRRGHKIEATNEGAGVWRYVLVVAGSAEAITSSRNFFERRATGLPLFDASAPLEKISSGCADA